MARTEVSQPVIPADGLNVSHMTFAAEIASGREIHLERLRMRCAIVVRNGCSSHFQVIASKEKQQPVARETHYIRNEDKLHCSLGLQLETFEKATAKKNADASARHRNGPSENARLTFAQRELRFQIFRQEYNEPGDDHQLHAGSQARDNVNGIRYEAPHRKWYVFDVSSVAGVDVQRGRIARGIGSVWPVLWLELWCARTIAVVRTAQ